MEKEEMLQKAVEAYLTQESDKEFQGIINVLEILTPYALSIDNKKLPEDLRPLCIQAKVVCDELRKYIEIGYEDKSNK